MASTEIQVVPEFEDTVLRSVYKYAAQGKSSREIADLVGIKPHEALAARRAVLDSVDPLTITEWRTKIMLDMQAMADQAFEAFENVSEEKAMAPLLVAANGFAKTILNEMRNMEKADNREVTALNAKRVKEILNLFEKVVVRLITYVDENTDLAYDDMLDMTKGWLRVEAEALDAS